MTIQLHFIINDIQCTKLTWGRVYLFVHCYCNFLGCDQILFLNWEKQEGHNPWVSGSAIETCWSLWLGFGFDRGPNYTCLGPHQLSCSIVFKGTTILKKKKKKGTTAPAYLGSITFFVVRVVRLLDSHSRERYCTLLRAQESG